MTHKNKAFYASLPPVLKWSMGVYVYIYMYVYICVYTCARQELFMRHIHTNVSLTRVDASCREFVSRVRECD